MFRKRRQDEELAARICSFTIPAGVATPVDEEPASVVAASKEPGCGHSESCRCAWNVSGMPTRGWAR